MFKKLLAALLATLMLLSFAGCLGSGSKKVYEMASKDFSDAGLTLTLTEGFFESEYDGYTTCYDSADAACFIIKESFTDFSGLELFSLDEYAQAAYEANKSRNPGPISEVEGLTAFEYTFFNESEKQTYNYFTTVFKGPDAFWLVQFAAKDLDYNTLRPYFIEWASSAKFAE